MYKFAFGASVDDILSDKGQIVDLIHSGFKLNAEFELISNVKTALIKKIREDEATKQYGDVLAYCAPLFLLQYNAKMKITFKDKDAIMGNPVGEALSNNFSDMFKGTLGEGKSIN